MAPRPSWSLLPSPPRLLRFSPSGIFAVLPACQAPGALLPVGSPAYPPACRSLATVSRWFAPSPPSGLLRWHPLVRPFLATLCLAYFLPPFPLSYPTIAFHPSSNLLSVLCINFIICLLHQIINSTRGGFLSVDFVLCYVCSAWNNAWHSSVQFSSVAQSCPTLCDPMTHSTPGLPVHHQLPEFTQIHVH